MGIKVKSGYMQDEYIPFGHVLKKNFLLQKSVSQVSEELAIALSKVTWYEQKVAGLLAEYARQKDEMLQKQQISEDKVELLCTKIETFEGIVQSMVDN